MSDNIPDLNKSYEEPLFYYNLAQGYMCPDSVDGFDNPNGFEDGDIVTPYVKIPFDQDLADSHDGGCKKRKREVLYGKESVDEVDEGEDDAGFESWLDGKVLGKNKTPEAAEVERKRERMSYESWKDVFVTFCPAAMLLPGYKGGLILKTF